MTDLPPGTVTFVFTDIEGSTELLKHLDSTQRYTRVTAHELLGAIKRLHWVG